MANGDDERFGKSLILSRRRCLLSTLLLWLLLLWLLLLCLPAAGWASESTWVARGSEWRYLDDGSDQGAAWRELLFDDSGWSAGSAHLGYGDGDEVTTVGFGGDPSNRFITTYFRHTFDVADPSLWRRVDLGLIRDDGALVYLNGQEVVRSNLPAGEVMFSTLATADENRSAEDLLRYFAVDPAELVAGENVLAVEIHQVLPDSRDISFDLELVGNDGLVSVTRGPYLQLATPTSMVVRWRTDPATDSRVEVGTDPEDLSLAFDDPLVTHENEVWLEGLTPSTTYFYRVGQAGTSESGVAPESVHSFRTPPLAGSVEATRIWVIGDSGSADLHAQRVRDGFVAFSANRPANLWLLLGDNAYDLGTHEEYQSALFELYPQQLVGTVVWPTLGNHDGQSANSEKQTGVYYETFTLPATAQAGGQPSGTEAYYSFDYANIHFICLESFETSRDVTDAMMLWLADDLANTTAEWIIAFWHHPPYSKGSHDSDKEPRMIEMRQNALPLLEGYGVDLVLTGHSHSYERSYLLDGHYGISDQLQADMIVDGGDGDPNGDGAYRKLPGSAPHEGAVYAVAGSSGKLTMAPLDHPAMRISSLLLGSVVIDVEGSEMTVTFVDIEGLAHDSFTIVKGQSSRVFGDDFESGDTVAWTNVRP